MTVIVMVENCVGSEKCVGVVRELLNQIELLDR